MPSTHLVCPHCGSTLTFGVTISPGAGVECSICKRKFTATNPVAKTANAKPIGKSATAKANAKPAPTSFSTSPMAAAKPGKARRPTPPIRRPVDPNSNFLVIAVAIAIVLMVTGGISFGVWKSMRSTGPGPGDADEAQVAKGDDKQPLPVEGKKPEAGGGKPLAANDEDDDDIRAKLNQEMKQVLKRKPSTKVDGPDPDREVAPPPPLPKNKVAGLDQEKIDGAIGRGVRYLKQTQARDGGWDGGAYDVGYSSLCGLTLLECKVPANDNAVQWAAAFVRARCAKIDHNYQASLAILFLDRLGDPRDRGVIQGLALRIMAAQDDAGGWTYGTPLLDVAEMTQLAAFLKPPPKQGSAPPLMQPEALSAKLKDLPVVRNRGKGKGQIVVVPNASSDNSNTQFALLALWAARRHGVPTDPCLLAGYQRFATTQHPTDLGWNYRDPGVSTDTMTCAGLIGLAIGHGTAPGADPKTGAIKPALGDPGVRSGLERLARNIGKPSADANQAFAMENLYFLWSVERVAMLYDLNTIGGKDWYGWGAQILLHNQQADGSWKSANYNGNDPRVDTCFALLFLKRSNLVPDLTRKLLNAGVRGP